jgi:hypothetical protein
MNARLVRDPLFRAEKSLREARFFLEVSSEVKTETKTAVRAPGIFSAPRVLAWVLASAWVLMLTAPPLCGTAEAVTIGYPLSFKVYSTPPGDRLPGERAIGLNETIALKSHTSRVLYLEAEKGEGTVSDDYTHLDFGLADATGSVTREKDVIVGVPGATVRVSYYPYPDQSGNGELFLSTEEVLETGVAQIRIATQVYQGGNLLRTFFSRPLGLRLGYDADDGGGSCSVAGAGILTFLLPLAFCRVKRGKSAY